MSTDRQLNIHTCECLLDHLVRLPYDEIEKCIINYVIFSLADKWLMFIHDDSEILFFCLDCLFIVRKFTYETIFCLKRSGVFDDTCLDLTDFSGINNCCQNCLLCLSASLKKYLVRVLK